jgi:hypothetical protein
MNIRSLKSFAAAGLVAVAALASGVAHGAIVAGSRVTVTGGVTITPSGSEYQIVFRHGASGITDVTVPGGTNPVQIDGNVNLGSYAAYNVPNPAPGHYLATITNLPVASAIVFPILNFLSLPGATQSFITGEDMNVVPSTFDLHTWTVAPSGTFLQGAGTGFINFAGGQMLGFFQFSVPFFTGTAGNYGFSATLEAQVIPVPGAVLLFGSGLLFLTLVGRFRRV